MNHELDLGGLKLIHTLTEVIYLYKYLVRVGPYYNNFN